MENLNQFTKKTIKLYDELENTEDNIIAITESSNLKLGTGARVWETAIFMSKYIIKQNLERGLFKKNKILELGSGTGLMSIVLASLGNEVYATDINDAMRLLEENITQNEAVIGKNGKITSFVLDWNFDRQKVKDILSQNNILKIDYILSSDVITNEKDAEIYLDTLNNIETVLKAQNPENLVNPKVIMGFRERDDISVDGFLGEAENRGFSFTRIENSDLDPDYSSSDIHFFILEFDQESRD